MKSPEHPGLFHASDGRTMGGVVGRLISGDKTYLAEATCNCGRCLDALERAAVKCRANPNPAKGAIARTIQAKLDELRNPEPQEPETEFPSAEV